MNSHHFPILITAEQIQSRVQELADKLNKDFDDKPVVIVGVMLGSLIFLSDLIRQLSFPHEIAILEASSYTGDQTTPGDLKIHLATQIDIRDKHLLLVDDILDTGQTLEHLIELFRNQQPLSVSTIVLLWKQSRTIKKIIPTYVGFPIDDHFVVGYGLDFDNKYRSLPEIRIYPSVK